MFLGEGCDWLDKLILELIQKRTQNRQNIVEMEDLLYWIPKFTMKATEIKSMKLV